MLIALLLWLSSDFIVENRDFFAQDDCLDDGGRWLNEDRACEHGPETYLIDHPDGSYSTLFTVPGRSGFREHPDGRSSPSTERLTMDIPVRREDWPIARPPSPPAD